MLGAALFLYTQVVYICSKGPSLYILRKDRTGSGSENDNFTLLYVLKMSLRRGVGVQKKPKHPYVI